MNIFGAALPTCSINPGLSWQWRWRKSIYREAGSETISALGYLFGMPALVTRSPEVFRQAVAMKGQFDKPPDGSEFVRQWGPNLFSETGNDWKKHRRIAAPAFGTKTYSLVFTETSRVYDEMLNAEGWTDQDIVDVPVTHNLTTKVGLIAISRCGFGSEIPWTYENFGSSKPSSVIPSENSMTLAEALMIVSVNSILRLVIPRWAYYLPIRFLKQLDYAHHYVSKFMNQLIMSRRSELANGMTSEYTDGHTDVFRLILEASENEGKYALSDEELRGNTFLMLFAGHETTASTMDATLAMLALHPDIQQDVYEQVSEVTERQQLTFDSLQDLWKVQACFLEASRMFPAAFMMVREALDDTVLTHVGPQNLPAETVVVEKGTLVVVDAIGLHYNPRIFPEPEAYKPERWYGIHDNDMTMFSTGSRACIGRRFALTEGTTFLARLLKDWKVEPMLLPNESSEQWRERVVHGVVRISFGIGDVPIRLRRRVPL